MAIDLREFASGDTDYIAKLNSNVSTLENAINGMQMQIGAIAGTDQLSVGMFFVALFNNADALIGSGSYKPTPSGTTLSVAAGGAYLSDDQTVVSSLAVTSLAFAGQLANTYYVQVDASGIPTRSDALNPGAVYSVVWTGSAFGAITRLVPVFFDTVESDASRTSSTLVPTAYSTLDARLERGEIIAAEAKDTADAALAAVGGLGEVSIRKVGCTVDNTTGIKGAIQIDFDGTIIGWSCIADAVGSLEIEISRKASSAPPAAPAIPNLTTDKISLTPIQLVSAQSAATAEAGVSTWTTDLAKWDVLQFNVLSVSILTRATVYLRIQEVTPSP